MEILFPDPPSWVTEGPREVGQGWIQLEPVLGMSWGAAISILSPLSNAVNFFTDL